MIPVNGRGCLALFWLLIKLAGLFIMARYTYFIIIIIISIIIIIIYYYYY